MPRHRARRSALLPAVLFCCAIMLGGAAAGASNRKLQQAAEPITTTNATTTTGAGEEQQAIGFQPGTFQEFMRLFLAQVGAPDFFFDHFVFSRFASAFVFTEQVAIQEAAVSLGQSIDTETGFVTYQPKQFYADAAVGALQDFGVSALFIANDFADLGEGTLPTLGTQFSVAVSRGVVNVPARRRRVLQDDILLGREHLREEIHRRRRRLQMTEGETGASGGEADFGNNETHAAEEAPEADSVIFNKAVAITPTQLVALSRLGFFDKFAETLPAHLRANLTATIKRNLRSAEEFMKEKNITEADVLAAGGPPAAEAQQQQRSSLKSARRRAEETAINATVNGGGEAGVGVAAASFPNFLDVPLIPFLDIEFNIAIVLQPNVIGTGLRLTPLAWRFGANGFIAQSFKVAPLLVGFQQTTVESLLEKAGVAVEGAAALLRGDAQEAADAAATLTAEAYGSVKGLPTVAVVAFDVYFREQISINGGDIAAIL